MLPRRHRLTRAEQFRAVLRGSGRAGTRALVVHRRDNAPTGDVRVGFVVSKAVGSSVVRHRVTRRLRALMAQRVADLPTGTDLVIRANPPAALADSRSLAHDLDTALARLRR